MNKPRWKDRRAHKKAKCWEKKVHPKVNSRDVRICPHGVAYKIRDGYDMFAPGKHRKIEKYRWEAVEEFFIRSGTYDW